MSYVANSNFDYSKIYFYKFCTSLFLYVVIIFLIIFFSIRLGNSEEIELYSQNEIKKYPINLIPSSLIKTPRDGASAIVVEKDSQRLWIYTSKHGQLVKVFEIPCSTGEVYGPKMVEGDKKTPEGIYFIKQTYEDRFLTPVYGTRAFTTDYPNLLDKIVGKTGSAIWLHGTNRELKPMDSNGCVAMNNYDVVKLDPYVVLDETPVIIVDRLDYVPVETNISQQIDILNFLSKWIESLNKGSYLEYLFYYESNYIPDMKWWAEWVDIRSRTALASNPVKAQFDYVGIYKHKNYFVVLLDFQVTSRYRTISVGKRKLFINSHNNNFSSYTDNSYKIIGDTLQTLSIKKKDIKSSYFIAAASQLDLQYGEYEKK
ncbi:MAG: L,D-transpeptidase [Desulfamplus sp.]|nr:L,D-transpeptidase [Desulfamplus sp.]